MRQLRFVLIAFLTSLLVINADFLRKTVVVLLCGVMSFNSASSNILLGDYGKADAVLPSGKVTVSDHADVVQEDGQKVAVCVFGVCVNVPNIPAVTPKVPSQNPQTPTTSPQQPANPDQQNPLAADNEKPTTNLTGTWVENGSTVTIDSRGCTAGYSGNLSIGGQKPQHRVFTLKQSGNQLTFSDATVTTTFGSGGSGTQSYQGTISGNQVTYIVSGNAGGGFKVESTGNISEDGNTVTFKGTCTGSRGSATAKGTFIWTREVSQFALTRATTTDAKSVTVDYTVEATNSGESSEPIHFEIYRSSTEDADHAKEKIGQQDIKIGENDIPNSTNSSPDKHRVKLNLPVDSLMPNTAAPYIVVVATYNGKKSTTYFRKWLLGAISHGFNRYNQAGVLFPTARGIGWLYSGDAFHPRQDPGGLPLWETNMAKKLKKYDKYDNVISFDWTTTCGLAQPEMAVQAGANLSKQITQWILAHRQHDGDVVDIHLIGHSRGAVVVTQALQRLSTASPSFEGGYIELTLLDPHPANNTLQNPWADFGRLVNLVSDRLVSGDNGRAAQIVGYLSDVKGTTQDFQSEARDPALNIPSGVKKTDVWYQHTEAACLTDAPDQEYIMNLWGLENTVIPNNNGMGIVMDFQDLTSNNKQHHCNQPAVGHNQVPDIYERSVVETGTLNRSN